METEQILLVNNALKELSEAKPGDDVEESLMVVIKTFKDLRQSNTPFEFQCKLGFLPDNSNTLSTDVGNINSTNNNREESKDISYHPDKERVGHYKLWKPKNGMIIFHHFWASDLSTMGGAFVPRQIILYDKSTLAPKKFSREREPRPLIIGPMEFSISRYDTIYRV